MLIKIEANKKSKGKKIKRIRGNSITPLSHASSFHEPEYDIIKDDVGYMKLVGRMFNNTHRSNSLRY